MTLDFILINVFLLGMIAICPPYISCECRNSDLHEITKLRNMTFPNHTNKIQTVSIARCATECIHTVSCLSISYHKAKRSCLLHSSTLSTTTDTADEDGWKSYRYCKGSCPSSCGYVYNATIDWCYRVELVNLKNAWEAVDECIFDGAHIVRIDSFDRQLDVMNVINYNGISSAYIGGISDSEDNNFTYEDGTPKSYFYWNAGHPKGRKRIIISNTDSYKWQNKVGGLSRSFICEF